MRMSVRRDIWCKCHLPTKQGMLDTVDKGCTAMTGSQKVIAVAADVAADVACDRDMVSGRRPQRKS